MEKETLYYIQNGYQGNSMVWWPVSNCGYTTEIKDAKKFTCDEGVKMLEMERHDFKMWDADYVDSTKEAHKVIIDGQYLRSSKCITKSQIRYKKN